MLGLAHLQREFARRFRHRDFVADQHADANAVQLDNRADALTVREVNVLAVRQLNLRR